MGTFFSGEFHIPHDSIAIKREKILKALEVPAEETGAYVDALIEKLADEAVALSEAQASYMLLENPSFHDHAVMHIGDTEFSLDKIVLSALKQSSHIAFFVGTAGPRIEEFSKSLLNEGHSLEGLIVDIIGSEIAEDGAEFIHRQIEKDMSARRLKITNRYSPGYCGWPVSDQQALFSLMKGHTCGVSLTESSLMLPIKSVSGIVGVGSDVKYRGYTCSRCDTEFCIYRDKR